MEFLYPNMLFCLFALAIPVIIHLFNFRKHKVVYFSNTAILKTIERENAKTKKLKYIIALIMRMLFIIGLVFAFAYPYNSDQKLNNDSADNLVAVYVDNSMSMQSHSSEITLFEDARSSARKLVDNLNPSQRFVLLTNSREIKNEYPMNKDEFLICLDEMQTEAGPMAFNDIYNNLLMIKKKNGFKTASLFMYSDFQYNMMNIDGIKADSTIQIVVFPLKSDYQKNIYIDSIWLQSPVLQKGLTNELNVRIVNESEKDIKGLPVNFEIDDHAVAFTTADITADSYTDVNMQFVIDKEGDRKAKVSINDFYITFDDQYDFVMKVRPVIKVIEIKPDKIISPLKLLFADDPLINYVEMNPYSIDKQSIMNCQLLVLNENAVLNETMQQMLLDFTAEGGSLAIFNSDNENVNNDYLYRILGLSMDPEVDTNSTRFETIARQNPFFDDIFVNLPHNAEMPVVQRHISFNRKNYSNVLSLITLQNGDPLMMMSRRDRGSVFVFSVPLDNQWSDLSDHAIFVPLMYKMAFIGGNVGKLSYTLGVDNSVNINDILISDNDEIFVRDENGNYEMIPMVENRNNRVWLRFYDALPAAGFYTVVENGKIVETLAWNDSRKESVMKFYNDKELTKVFNDNKLNIIAVMDYDEIHSGDLMKVIVRKSMLWKSFILLSLISLLIEILVLRFWKK